VKQYRGKHYGGKQYRGKHYRVKQYIGKQYRGNSTTKQYRGKQYRGNSTVKTVERNQYCSSNITTANKAAPRTPIYGALLASVSSKPETPL
jgi:hypothetical protein